MEVLLLSADAQLIQLFDGLPGSRRHRLTVHSTLQQACDMCRKQQPAVVVFDADQPVGEPGEVCRALRRASAPGTLLVAVTKRNHGQCRRRLVEAGVDDYWVLDEHDSQSLALRLQLLERAVANNGGSPSDVSAPLLADAIGRLLPALPTMLVVVDRQGRVYGANRGPTQHLPPEQMIGRVGFDFLVPRDREMGRKTLSRALERGEPQPMATCDIFDLHWEVRLLPFVDTRGEPFALAACNDVTSHKDAERTLDEFQESLRHILECQERSRENVASILHDEIAQQLTSVLFALEALASCDGEQPELKEQAAQMARGTLQEAIDMCRRLAGALTPLGLRKFGLMPAVECLLQELRGRSGPAIDLVTEGRFDRLPPAVELALFRMIEKLAVIAQPLGRDRVVQLKLECNDHAVSLRLEIDSQGLNHSELAPFRLALQEIGVRAKAVGGSMLSAPGNDGGLTFAVRFPIESQ